MTLAILSGMADDAMKALMGRQLSNAELAPVGTRYQAALEILALHYTEYNSEAIGRIRRVWGGMLKHGATTFYEAYAEGKQTYNFYGRPYAKMGNGLSN